MNSKQQLEVMRQVVGLLNAMGIDAVFEVPGYVSILRDGHEISFGTANENWGWNDEDGNGGDLGIKGSEKDASLIAGKISEIVRQGALGFHNAPKTE